MKRGRKEASSYALRSKQAGRADRDRGAKRPRPESMGAASSRELHRRTSRCVDPLNKTKSMGWSPRAVGDDEAAVSPRLAAAQVLLVLVQSVGLSPARAKSNPGTYYRSVKRNRVLLAASSKSPARPSDVHPIGNWFIASQLWRARSG